MREQRFTLVLAVAVGVMSSCVGGVTLAQEQADFLTGTYATANGCKMQKKLAAGTPRSIETVPDTLDAKGFHGWEGDCAFTKVWVHKPGEVWSALMFCAEGNTSGPQIYSFAKDPETGSFDVSSISQTDPEVFQSCDVKKEK